MIKLINHNDLDAVGCAVLSKIAYGDKNVDISYCGYDNVNETVIEVINNHEQYDKIFITDISVNEEVAAKLDTIKEKVVLLDHHSTALELNKYSWAKVIIEEHGEKTSGTRMFYDYLEEALSTSKNYLWRWDRLQSLFYFVENIKRYDTWLWSTKYNDATPKKINDLLYLYGRERFIEDTLNKFQVYKEFNFSDTDELLLELEQKKKNKYIERKNEQIIVAQIQDCKAGIVFAEQYISELGNELAKKHEELDFIVIISDKTISYRGIKDNVNLSEIARIYGGGGHPKASGSQISAEQRQRYIDILFK